VIIGGILEDQREVAMLRAATREVLDHRPQCGQGSLPGNGAAGCIPHSAHSEPPSPGESMISPSMSRRIVRALDAPAGSPPSPRSICSRYSSAARGMNVNTRAFSRSAGRKSSSSRRLLSARAIPACNSSAIRSGSPAFRRSRKRVMPASNSWISRGSVSARAYDDLLVNIADAIRPAYCHRGW